MESDFEADVLIFDFCFRRVFLIREPYDVRAFNERVERSLNEWFSSWPNRRVLPGETLPTLPA